MVGEEEEEEEEEEGEEYNIPKDGGMSVKESKSKSTECRRGALHISLRHQRDDDSIDTVHSSYIQPRSTSQDTINTHT